MSEDYIQPNTEGIQHFEAPKYEAFPWQGELEAAEPAAAAVEEAAAAEPAAVDETAPAEAAAPTETAEAPDWQPTKAPDWQPTKAPDWQPTKAKQVDSFFDVGAPADAPADAPAEAPAAAAPRPSAVIEYNIRVYNPELEIDASFSCEAGENILDAAARADVELPYSCLNGGCFTCCGQLTSGSADMGDQYMLEDRHVEKGFYLLCCSAPTSDLEILTHQEQEVQ